MKILWNAKKALNSITAITWMSWRLDCTVGGMESTKRIPPKKKQQQTNGNLHMNVHVALNALPTERNKQNDRNTARKIANFTRKPH